MYAEPGVRGDRNVPMIPDADSVARSGSLSNHWRHEIRRAHRQQLDEGRLLRLRQCREAAPEARQRQQPARIAQPAERRCRLAEQRPHEARHLGHQQRVLLVRLGIALRVAPDLAHGHAVVVDAPQVVANLVAGRRERAVDRQHGQTVADQVELADDLRPQQRHDVRSDAELEAGDDLLGHRRAAQDVRGARGRPPFGRRARDRQRRSDRCARLR